MPKRWPVGALLVQSLLVVAIYWPTRRLAFASDAWAYLERLRHGLSEAVATPIGYHWQPVACAWIAAIRGAFGERAAVFQAVNLIQLTVVGHLTFQLGKRLLADSTAALLGSLLVLGSAAFYEATYWPLAGNMHLLAALLYVLSTVLACDVATGRRVRGGRWLLGLTVLAAVFSHPAMVTCVVVCALIVLVLGRGPADGKGSARRRGRLGALVPLAVVAALFFSARIAFDAYSASAPRPGFEPMRLVWLVRSGLLPVFSLRGSLVVLERLLALGPHVENATRVWIGTGAWLAAATVGAGLCLSLARDGVRLLVAFLAIHLAALTLASGLSSRQCVVPSIPAALLSAWALRAGAERVAARVGTGAAAALARAVPAAVVALLIAGAQADHRTALDLHLRVAQASRALVAHLKAVPPGLGPFRLTLINMPAYLSERGISAFAFQNGLGEMAHLTNSAVTKVDLWRIPILGAPENIVAEIPWLTRSGLSAQLAEPHRVVLLYEDQPAGVRRLSLADVDGLTARWSSSAPD